MLVTGFEAARVEAEALRIAREMCAAPLWGCPQSAERRAQIADCRVRTLAECRVPTLAGCRALVVGASIVPMATALQARRERC